MPNPNVKLKKRRIQCGYTQVQLAECSNTNVRNISVYEQDINRFNNANISTVLRICDALGCTVEDLIDRSTLPKY